MKKLLIVVSLLLLLPITSYAALTAMQTGQGQVTLGWVQSISPDVVANGIYWSTTSNGYTKGNRQATIAAAETFTVEGLAPGTYFFVVTAIDEAGNESGFSNEVSCIVSIPDTEPPEPPTGLHVINVIWAALKWFFTFRWLA